MKFYRQEFLFLFFILIAFYNFVILKLYIINNKIHDDKTWRRGEGEREKKKEKEIIAGARTFQCLMVNLQYVYLQVNDVDDDAVIIVESEYSPQAPETTDGVAKKRRTKSPISADPSPKKRKVETKYPSGDDDDICIVENNEEVQFLNRTTNEPAVNNKKQSIKKATESVDDDCQIVYNDADPTNGSPTKKVKATNN